MAKTQRTVAVADKRSLSSNMVRVTLQGDSLRDFPVGYEGGYVKLLFASSADKTLVRSYTVREFLPDENRLVIDMVNHGDSGPAARWVNQAAVGDLIEIIGPGACQLLNLEADWFVLAGDMSALPAISVNLERLPPGARGHVVLEVISERDKTELQLPPGVCVHWIVNDEPEQPNTELEDSVMALPWQDGQLSVWVSGEFSTSRTLRQYFRQQRNVEKAFMYVSSYWKIGATDEGMKAAKRADSESW